MFFVFFFFKQKTAYEMRISDWSSDVCSSDLLAEEAFIVLRDALRKTRKVGLGQLTLRGREYVVSLKPCGRGMVLETLRYADEVNKAASYFRDIGDAKPDEELLELAETLIQMKTAPFDASVFHDRSAEHTSELQSLMRLSYAVFCLKTKYL